MGFINRLKGEEPGIIKQVFHIFDGKGAFGEYLVDYALEHGNIPGRFAVFNNIYVPTRGRMTEIDALMLHESGIFVFESKNYSGWIFGSAEQKQWTQVLKGGKKNHFYSPMKQNRSHINALRKYLDLEENAFVSFIVFSERCELKKVPKNTSDCRIFRRHHLVREVKRAMKDRERIFTDEQLGDLGKRLSELAKTEEKAEEHIANVKAIQEKKLCPWCNSELVLWGGENGKFLACSTFPKCWYKTSME